MQKCLKKQICFNIRFVTYEPFSPIKINIIILFIRMYLFNWIIVLIQIEIDTFFFHKNKLFIYDLKNIFILDLKCLKIYSIKENLKNK